MGLSMKVRTRFGSGGAKKPVSKNDWLKLMTSEFFRITTLTAEEARHTCLILFIATYLKDHVDAQTVASSREANEFIQKWREEMATTALALDAPPDAPYSVQIEGGRGRGQHRRHSPGGKVLETTTEEGKRHKIRHLAHLIQKPPVIKHENRFSALEDEGERATSPDPIQKTSPGHKLTSTSRVQKGKVQKSRSKKRTASKGKKRSVSRPLLEQKPLVEDEKDINFPPLDPKKTASPPPQDIVVEDIKMEEEGMETEEEKEDLTSPTVLYTWTTTPLLLLSG